ncbi:MAG: LamG-like jellyroll fold domain-containing protein [Ilumatobacteraceae bacterium]
MSVAGVYVLRLTADDGEKITHDDVVVTANPAPPNQPPTVSAGPDITIPVSAQAVLDGTVSDDGVPLNPGVVSVEWTKLSGPGIVTFTNKNAVDTAASFGQTGTYVLRLSASDGAATSSDLLIVRVGESSRVSDGLVSLYTFDEGSGTTVRDIAAGSDPLDLVIDQPANVTWQPGAIVINSPTKLQSTLPALEITDAAGTTNELSIEAWVIPSSTNPEVPGRVVSVGTDQNVRSVALGQGFWTSQPRTKWESRLRTSSSYNNPMTSGSTTVTAGLTHVVLTRAANGTMTMWVNGAVASTQSTGGTMAGWDPSLPLVVGNDAVGNRPFLGTIELVAVYDRALDEADVVKNFNSGPDGNTIVGGTNVPPSVDAGADVTVQRPATAVVTGVVADDGQPTVPGTVTTLWSQVSGPGRPRSATRALCRRASTSSAAGVYVLRLTADDGELQFADDVTVRSLGNEMPVIFAGFDASTADGEVLQLDATLSDDGLPNPPGALTTTWSQVSGPGTATFGSVSVADTTVVFDTPGQYVLRLTGSDSEFEVTDEVTIDVVANQAPLIDAGPDRFAEYPAPTSLNGSVSDDGYPLGGSVTVSWTKISGPGIVTFSAPAAVDSDVSMSAPGTYVFRLTATDGLLSSSDDVTVTSGQNVPPTVSAGADTTTPALEPMFLDATVTDDGLPSVPGAVGLTWTVVSGPGTVTFVDPTSADTEVVFSTAGSYVLRLTADDGGANLVTDELTVEVTDALRVSDNLVALYTFDEGSGSKVTDVSGNGTPMDLTIANPANVSWAPGSLTVNTATVIASNGPATRCTTRYKVSPAPTRSPWKPGCSRRLRHPRRRAASSAWPRANPDATRW